MTSGRSGAGRAIRTAACCAWSRRSSGPAVRSKNCGYAWGMSRPGGCGGGAAGAHRRHRPLLRRRPDRGLPDRLGGNQPGHGLGPGGADRMRPGMRDSRGVGAGSTTPNASVNVPRAARCAPSGASARSNTGATHPSTPSNAAAHSSRVRKTRANISASAAMPPRRAAPERRRPVARSPARQRGKRHLCTPTHIINLSIFWWWQARP
jgi:hypothetical protein